MNTAGGNRPLTVLVHYDYSCRSCVSFLIVRDYQFHHARAKNIGLYRRFGSYASNPRTLREPYSVHNYIPSTSEWKHIFLMYIQSHFESALVMNGIFAM